MRVLKRHRGADGTLLGYTVKDTGKSFFLPASSVMKGGYHFTNADILANGEVRAKKGETIKTEVERLPRHLVKVERHSPVTEVTVSDYYGSEYLDDCRRIRESVQSGRLRFDISGSVDDVLLFDIIRGCGYAVKEFVMAYLGCLQPYSMQEFANTAIDNGVRIWRLDLGYHYSLLVKVHCERDEVVVSFHESSKGGKYFCGDASFFDKRCAVFVDNAMRSGDYMSVSYTVQHGFLRSSFNCDTKYCVNGVALVWYQEIAQRFVAMLNDYLLRVYGVYSARPGFNGLPLVTVDGFGGLSFMANGVSVLNTLCLIIDLYASNATPLTKQALTAVAVPILEEVPVGMRRMYLSDLQTKYGINYKNVLYRSIVKELGDGR